MGRWQHLRAATTVRGVVKMVYFDVYPTFHKHTKPQEIQYCHNTD